MLIQAVASDDARGDTEEAWTRAQAYFETIGEDELIDPLLSGEQLLFRLFHEDGARVFDAKPLSAFCRCSVDRIKGILAQFPAEERADMVEADGKIRVTCEYCARVFAVAPDGIDVGSV
jgi:molecular chaperone Hsp33